MPRPERRIGERTRRRGARARRAARTVARRVAAGAGRLCNRIWTLARRTGRERSLRALLVVAPLIGVVTLLSNRLDALSFLLFPPLAAVAFGMFAYPEHQRRVPWDVPVALVVGALAGWVATAFSARFLDAPAGAFAIDPVAAMLCLGLTGVGLWAADAEWPPAYAVGLLLPFAGVPPSTYTVNVAVASVGVAVVFVGWRELAARLPGDTLTETPPVGADDVGDVTDASNTGDASDGAD